MPHRPVADIRLRDLIHRDGGLDPHDTAELFERVRKPQGVDGGREHPHMVRSGPVHAAARPSPPEIASAHHDRDLDARVHAFLDRGAYL